MLAAAAAPGSRPLPPDQTLARFLAVFKCRSFLYRSVTFFWFVVVWLAMQTCKFFTELEAHGFNCTPCEVGNITLFSILISSTLSYVVNSMVNLSTTTKPIFRWIGIENFQFALISIFLQFTPNLWNLCTVLTLKDLITSNEIQDYHKMGKLLLKLVINGACDSERWHMGITLPFATCALIFSYKRVDLTDETADDFYEKLCCGINKLVNSLYLLKGTYIKNKVFDVG